MDMDFQRTVIIAESVEKKLDQKDVNITIFSMLLFYITNILKYVLGNLSLNLFLHCSYF